MASQTLTNQTVESTYQGVLHANGEALPLAGIATVYDGSGQSSALSLGLSSQGAAIAGGLSCSGQLTAGSIRYTTTDSISGANFPLVSDGNKTAVFGQITSNALIDLSPNPAGQFGNIQYMTVNSKGLVTGVVGGSATSNAWVTFDGKDVAFSYVINNLTVTCTAFGHSLKQGNVITIKNASNSNLNGSFAIQSSDINASTFTFANPTGATTGSGTGVVDVTVKSSSNVASVSRISTGIFRINFSNAFKNQDYVTLCGAKYPNTVSTDLENLQANTVSANKDSVVVRSFYITSGNQVTEYDDGYVSVYCIGNTTEDKDNNPTPATFDNVVYTSYVWSEAANPGVQTQNIVVTPSLMAANKWNALIVGAHASMYCRNGGSSANSTAIVNGSTTSSIRWSTGGQSGQEVYFYHVFVYSNNTLKYKQFYSSNGGIYSIQLNATDANDSRATSLIINGISSQGLRANSQVVNQTTTGDGTWFINFVNSYYNSLVDVNSVQVIVDTNAGHGGPCYGGYYSNQNLIKYFTP